MDWPSFWFVMLGILLAGYAILDGFDFGVGILHRVARTNDERRVLINAIGPVWDGNEVWLVTFGGAMFAAFPEAYATVFSGMYAAFMIVLGGLIFRACAIEFRGKVDKPWWRSTWDAVFTIASLITPLVFGVGVGNAMAGLPLDERGILRAGFLSLLRPYPLLIGLLTIVMFAMHGGLYLQLKTEGELKSRLRRWVWRLYLAFLTLFAVATAWTLLVHPQASDSFREYPLAVIVPLLMALAVANVPRCLKRGGDGQAFFSSGCTIAALVFVWGLALYPNLVFSDPNPQNSLTVEDAASSESTLKTMALIAGLGLPFVLMYSGAVYWTFRGKVQLDPHSY